MDENSVSTVTSALREPPHSIEAEQAVLGGLIISNDQWLQVASVLSEADFYLHDHRVLFRVISRLSWQQEPFDTVIIRNALITDGIGPDLPIMSYVSELAENTASTANIRSYAETIRERAIFRKIISVCDAVSEKARSPEGMSTDDLLEDAERQILAIAEERPTSGGPVPLSMLLKNSIARIDTMSRLEGGITGLATGYSELDAITLGLQPTDLVIVAGRPSMGKTSFAMNLVENAGRSQGKVVLVYSLEMPGESLVLRMLASCGGIDQARVRSGKLEEDDWPLLAGAVTALTSANIFIDDTAGISPSEMRSRTRRLRREHGEIALIMVDYLQLMQVPALAHNRTLEVSEVSRSLKAMAKEFNCPVVALSQLNRSLEKREDKRPMNSDLRESGAIEQDADVIMFVYRDEVYHPESEDKGIAEIIIGKARNGETGTVKLGFVGKYTRFESLPGQELSS
ncbi:replicative DNA helicase [Pseudomonas syringae pv. actinidiae]|nr:replicative DNA helicase [Pseudomonas syringae pv. actinidiae]